MLIKRGFSQEGLQTLFEKEFNSYDISFGTVEIQPGQRVPDNGLSVHEGNEYSFIVEGEVEGESGGKPFKVTASDASIFPAGEEHWTINNSSKPCKIIWFMVNEK